MGNSIILISSLTSAMRAQNLLTQRGINSCIRKIVNNQKLGGCGYGLEPQGDINVAVNLLQSSGIRTLGIL